MPKLSNMSYKNQRILIIFLFSLVPVVLLLTFSYLPVFKMFQYSFTSWNGLSKNMEYIGFDNYKTIFTKPEYFAVFKVSLYYFLPPLSRWGWRFILPRF